MTAPFCGMNEDANENARGTICSDLSFDLRGGSLPDAPLSLIGVRSLNPVGPNSTFLRNLPRTLPKRQPGRGHAKCFGQRFEHIHAGLCAFLDVGNGARTDPNQSCKGSLGQSALRSQGRETFPHAVRCRCPLVSILFTETIP